MARVGAGDYINIPALPVPNTATGSGTLATTTPSSIYQISEAQCERAVFFWEIHEDQFPIPVIPAQFIINPQNEPDHDSSLSIIDLMENVPSGRFFRGQEVNKPMELQLYLKNSVNNQTAETEVHIVLTCEKICIHSSVNVLVKVACEIIDEQGLTVWMSGDVYTANARPFVQGDSHAISLGTKKELQNRRSELVRNGVLRFRLRLNIYKDLRQESKNNENVHNPPPSKRRRMESSVSSGLTDLLSSLESLWSNRAQTGDITILCDGQEIKAHRFILSGRSKVFMEMLDSKMETQEKSSCVIKVDDISPEIITAMLEILYTNATSHFDWANTDHICALIYSADKYWIQPLMTKCYQQLMKLLDVENFAKIAKVTFMYNCGKPFKDAVRHYFERNQITLNGIESFRKFAMEDFEYFYKMFLYRP